jgi:hypothetical protein
MSASALKADVADRWTDVSFVPQAEVTVSSISSWRRGEQHLRSAISENSVVGARRHRCQSSFSQREDCGP